MTDFRGSGFSTLDIGTLAVQSTFKLAVPIFMGTVVLNAVNVVAANLFGRALPLD